MKKIKEKMKSVRKETILHLTLVIFSMTLVQGDRKSLPSDFSSKVEGPTFCIFHTLWND